MKMSTLVIVGLAPALAAGCAESSPDKPAEQIAAHIYLPQMTSEEIAESAENLVRGTVSGIGAARRIQEDVPGASRDFEAVFTPVEILVTETLRGDIEIGATVTLRFFGGTADGLTYEHEGLPTVDDIREGSALIVAASRIGTTSGDIVFTPGAVWQVEGHETTALGDFATDDEDPTLAELTGR